MDEPFTGLDPVNLILLREAFAELRDRGRTVIFSTHQMETAEAMCESVAIVDHGRLVAGGRIRDLKRASGRRTLRIGVGREVMPASLGSLPGVGVPRSTADGVELELLPGGDPAAILAAILAGGATVSRFEVVEPSLEALFIEYVGRPAEDDPTLVAGASPAFASGTAG
jgi:ABC-2 type transport system ATP-binding protein